jgi:hypothetical protein
MNSIESGTITSFIESEKYRISGRDKEQLANELSLIGQVGLNLPAMGNLDDYFRFISPSDPKTVRWDFLRHYAVSPDSAYLTVYKENGGTICKHHYQDYEDRLLTHSLSGQYWRQAEEKGYLAGHPQVSFSSGQVVFKGAVYDGLNSMTVIFDRQVLDQVYTLLPYSDHEVELEREIRAYEPISLDLAIGWIPTEKFILELNHWGQLTCVCGKRMMADLESQYLAHGVLNEIL